MLRPSYELHAATPPPVRNHHRTQFFGPWFAIRLWLAEGAALFRLPVVSESEHVKPFITPEISESGKKVLKVQWEGIAPSQLAKLFNDSCLTAFAISKKQSPRAAWLLQLIFDNRCVLELSSASTDIKSWNEVGSLNILFLKEDGVKFHVTTIAAFRIANISRLVYEDDEFITECGITFRAVDSIEIVVSCGVPPGSVSVSAPFSHLPFEPEFPIEDCRRVKF